MANSLQTEPVRDLLDRLFRAAGEDDLRPPRIAERYPGGLGQATAVPGPSPPRAIPTKAA